MSPAAKALDSLKPYPAYKDSGVEWIGEVPERWEIQRLNQIAGMNRRVWPEDTDPDLEISYIEISDVDGLQKPQPTPVAFGTAPSRARRIVRSGDVIISTVRTYLKAVQAIDQSLDGCTVSTGFAVLTPREGLVPSFLGFALLSDGFMQTVIAYSRGVSYPAIEASRLSNLPLAVPPPPEQLAIAAFLDHETARIDELMREQEQLLGDLAEKRRATITQAVTKGLDPAEMQRTSIAWLQNLPAHWQSDSLKRLVQIQGGMTPPDEPHLWNGGVLWVTPKDMKRPVISSTEDTVTDLAVVEGRLKLFPPGCLLMVVRSGILRHTVPVAVTGASVTVNQDMKVIQPLAAIRAKFLYYFFEGLGPSLLPVIQKVGATVESINMTALRNLQVPIPPLHEQDEIITHLDAQLAQIDELAEEVRANIEDMKLLRSTLITASTTGKIDVRDWTPA